MIDDLFEIVPLHPDLVPYIQRRSIGVVIHHPLVISIMHSDFLNKGVNLTYLLKKESLENAIAEKNWHYYVFLHERPYRYEALLEIRKNLKGKAFWDLVSAVWIDSENIHQHVGDWIDLWSVKEKSRQSVMNKEERKFLKELPETFSVWRGTGHADVVDGLSWTLDRNKAIWFAGRFSKSRYLAEGTVKKKDVVAYFARRNEQEIVIFPDNVMNTSVKRLIKP
jgi:hypothetical protein